MNQCDTLLSALAGSRRCWLAMVGLLSVFLAGSLYAASAGKNAAEFLQVNPDPRSAAMGEGSVALIADYPAAVFSNPAKLLGLNRPWMSAQHISYPGDIQYNLAGVAMPAAFGNITAHVGYLTYGSIPGTEVDAANNVITVNKNVEAADALALISYSFPLTSNTPIFREFGAIGISLKLLQSNLAEYSSEAVALDVGSLFNVPYLPGVTAGFAYRNFGSNMKFVKSSYPLPTSFDCGLAYANPKLQNLCLSLDLHTPDYGSASSSIGISFSPIYFVTLRGGLHQRQDSQLNDISAGLGLEFGDLSIDYAMTPLKDFAPMHHVGISIALGGIVKLESASEYFLSKHYREACAAYYEKDYIEARQLFEEILSVYPDHGPSQEYLSKIVAALERMEEEKVKRTNRYLQEANAAMERRDYISARQYYKRVLALNPDAEDARIGLEQVWQKLDEIKQEQVRQQNKKKILKLWKDGQEHYQKGDFVRAKEEFRQILAIDPSNEAAGKFVVEVDNQLSQIAASQVNELYTQATEYFKKGVFVEALKYFEAVAVAAPHRLDAQDFVAKCRKSIAEQEEKDRQAKLLGEQSKVRAELEAAYDKALKYYEKGDNAQAYQYFVRAEELANQYEFTDYIDNIKNYLSMVKITLAEYHYKKGFDLFRKNSFEAAAVQYRKALEYNPDNVSAKVELERIGKDLAQRCYEQGMEYYSRSEMDKAKEMMLKALSYDPNKEDARRVYERIK